MISSEKDVGPLSEESDQDEGGNEVCSGVAEDEDVFVLWTGVEMK